MKKGKLNPLSKLGITCGFLLVSGSVIASSSGNPVGVPVADPAPLVCVTDNFSIEAITGVNGVYPISVLCDPLDPTKGMCSDYGYRINSNWGKKADHALFAVSADQQLFATSPSAYVSQLGAGDSTTEFLEYTKHEYPVRFNSNATVYEGHIYIVGRSSPRISTVLIKSGSKIKESCLIAGPGIAGDPFAPVVQSESAVVAGGKCEVTKIFDASGNLVDITLPEGSECVVGSPEDGVLVVNGEPLRNNTSRDGITFGNNTSTCYGPPVPRVPKCVCTKAPCP